MEGEEGGGGGGERWREVRGVGDQPPPYCMSFLFLIASLLFFPFLRLLLPLLLPLLPPPSLVSCFDQGKKLMLSGIPRALLRRASTSFSTSPSTSFSTSFLSSARTSFLPPPPPPSPLLIRSYANDTNIDIEVEPMVKMPELKIDSSILYFL